MRSSNSPQLVLLLGASAAPEQGGRRSSDRLLLAAHGASASWASGYQSCRLQSADAEQVVRGPDEPGCLLGPSEAAEAGLAQAPDGLQPAEDFLHPLANPLTEGIPDRARRAAIQPR